MSDQQEGRRGGSFRRPASYSRDPSAGQDRKPEAAPGDEATGGTRQFAPEEPASAGSRTRPVGAGDGTATQARREMDQTLVSPLARERVRADVRVPDPAYPPRQDRQAYPGQGVSRGQYRQQPPLRRRQPARQQQPPERPPMAPSPQGYAYQPQPAAPEPGRTHAVARGVLLLVSWLFRIGAWVLVALVIANSFTVGNRVTLMRITERVTQMLPSELAGLYVLDTPFGGAFRGDLAIMAIILFVLDWIVARIRRHLR